MYATVADIQALWRPLTPAEQQRASALLPVVEGLLEQAARNEGIAGGLDQLILENKLTPTAAKAVVVDVVSRILRQSTKGDAMSQESQSALGYTWQGTYAVPGGGIANAIMRNDLKRLGIHKQRIRTVEMYDTGHHDSTHDPDANGCGRV